MEAFLLLADAASADSGSNKVNLLGAGWSITGPIVPSAAISVFLRAPWDEVGKEIKFGLHLIDSSDHEVRPFVVNDRPLGFEGAFALPDAAELDDMGKRVPLNIAFCIPLPPLPLQPGHTYRWVFEVSDRALASVDFAVRSEN
ncbi:DUF6941 family protein [Streptosporangium roseum]|uniref:DUF6941 family protein n=1 Tax=Streptosporangium roseum TaxID=2001 RepID=UPI0012DCE0A1|nr:hypothetical protein [Streptosporangium roseum]